MLLHFRVRVTALLGLATLCKRANFSSTVTSTCLWCLSSSRTLLTPPRFIQWTPHITPTTISHPYPTNFTISLTHTWQLSHKNTLPPSTPPTPTLLFFSFYTHNSVNILNSNYTVSDSILPTNKSSFTNSLAIPPRNTLTPPTPILRINTTTQCDQSENVGCISSIDLPCPRQQQP